jgi:hypothetical protein
MYSTKEEKNIFGASLRHALVAAAARNAKKNKTTLKHFYTKTF